MNYVCYRQENVSKFTKAIIKRLTASRFVECFGSLNSLTSVFYVSCFAVVIRRFRRGISLLFLQGSFKSMLYNLPDPKCPD